MPSVYEIVTEKIIKQLESGVAPWRKPWTCQTPANLLTQKEYRGLNVLTLASQGFPSRFWVTFNQATKLGGRIRKGEKSSPVIFWNVGDERETTTQDGAKETSRPFLLRYYRVFNLSQTEGIDIPASLLQETRTNDPIEMDCTLEMRQPGWAHFAGKGLQSEAKAILTEVPADGC
jgi:antirestriction protein ArdC